MTPDQFWSATFAQIVALIPDPPTDAVERGDASDLIALAGM